MIVVKFFAYLRGLTGEKETRVAACQTVEELLHKLCAKYGKRFADKVLPEGELGKEIIILVNGRHITHMAWLKTQLAEGDEVSIFPVVAGG